MTRVLRCDGILPVKSIPDEESLLSPDVVRDIAWLAGHDVAPTTSWSRVRRHRRRGGRISRGRALGRGRGNLVARRALEASTSLG